MDFGRGALLWLLGARSGGSRPAITIDARRAAANHHPVGPILASLGGRGQ
jgi:hypothetical protein